MRWLRCVSGKWMVLVERMVVGSGGVDGKASVSVSVSVRDTYMDIDTNRDMDRDRDRHG